jgi:hypothetical protein
MIVIGSIGKQSKSEIIVRSWKSYDFFLFEPLAVEEEPGIQQSMYRKQPALWNNFIKKAVTHPMVYVTAFIINMPVGGLSV